MKPIATLLFLSCSLFTHYANGQTHRISLNLTYGSNVNYELKGIHAPQVSFSWQNKLKHWHELELGNLYLAKGDIVTTQGKVAAIHFENFMLRYQYTVPVLSQKISGPLQLTTGAGIQTYNQLSQVKPFISTLYRTSFYKSWFNAYIAPGLTYTWKERWYASLNIPVNIETLELNSNRVQNPAWSRAEQRYTETEFTMFHNPGMLFRAGIGATF